MPFTLQCGDVIPGCTAQFADESKDGLLAQVVVHAGADHPDIELTSDVQAAVSSAVQEE